MPSKKNKNLQIDARVRRATPIGDPLNRPAAPHDAMMMIRSENARRRHADPAGIAWEFVRRHASCLSRRGLDPHGRPGRCGIRPVNSGQDFTG
jgi:hypothetical protein